MVIWRHRSYLYHAPAIFLANRRSPPLGSCLSSTGKSNNSPYPSREGRHQPNLGRRNLAPHRLWSRHFGTPRSHSCCTCVALSCRWRRSAFAVSWWEEEKGDIVERREREGVFSHLKTFPNLNWPRGQFWFTHFFGRKRTILPLIKMIKSLLCPP